MVRFMFFLEKHKAQENCAPFIY
ncbi:hypothetical protein Zm00014a_040308 [Zea mays]|uniref:Uncharacterized protein n=1 Tax=Zea mays TaxID=4577 RepID=A0A3L6DF75_MAIZE|nr:hypothetical protein Zm00014a_040308 [Zea mays]